MKSRIKVKLQAPTDPSKDRLVFEVLQAVKGMTVKQIVDGTEKTSMQNAPVAEGTIRNWYRPVKRGGTRYPRAHTMDRVLMAHGKQLGIIDLQKRYK